MGMYQGKPEKGFVQPVMFHLASFQEPLHERELPKIQTLMYMQMATNGFFVRSGVTTGNYESAVRLEVVSATSAARKMWLIVDNYADVQYAHLEEISAAHGNLHAPWDDARWMDPARIMVDLCERFVQENYQTLSDKIGTPHLIEALQDFLEMAPWSEYLFHTEESIYLTMPDDEEDILDQMAAGEMSLDELALSAEEPDDELDAGGSEEQISAVCWRLICGSQLYLTDHGATLQYQPSQLVDMYFRRKELSVFQREIVSVARH